MFLILIGGRHSESSGKDPNCSKVTFAEHQFLGSWMRLVTLTESGCSPVIIRNVMTASERTQTCDETGWRSGIREVHSSWGEQGTKPCTDLPTQPRGGLRASA